MTNFMSILIHLLVNGQTGKVFKCSSVHQLQCNVQMYYGTYIKFDSYCISDKQIVGGKKLNYHKMEFTLPVHYEQSASVEINIEHQIT